METLVWENEGAITENGIEAPYTCTSFTITFELGVRGASISENAIRAATAKATVVKKPKTFWARTTVECMAGYLVAEAYLFRFL